MREISQGSKQLNIIF